MFCAEVQLEMPDVFPCAGFTALRNEGRRILLPKKATSPAWGEFGRGLNLVAWRFRSGIEAFDRVIGMLGADRPVTTHEDEFRFEEAFFGGVVAFVSTIECLAWATYVLAADDVVLGRRFSTVPEHRRTPRQLAEDLLAHSAAGAVARAWNDATESPVWKTLVAVRIRTFHRSNLPRRTVLVIGTNPSPQPYEVVATSTTGAMQVTPERLAADQQWLASTVKRLLEAGVDLAQTHAVESDLTPESPETPTVS